MSKQRLWSVVLMLWCVGNEAPALAQGNGWRIQSEAGGQVAQISTSLSFGEEATLIVDCYEGRPSLMLGYSGNHTQLAEPQRTAASRYMRTIYVEEATVVLTKFGKILNKISWNTSEGGTAKLSRQQLNSIYEADSILVMGGAQPLKFGGKGARIAIESIRPRCKL